MDCNSIKINGYQIKEVLGHGGMATVYLAIQESFERKVAIKIMAEQLSSDSSFQERFLQEAKIVSRLIHPNIVTVYDVSVVNNHHYLSMEYIDGVDLKEKLHTISLFHLIKVIKEVALALDYAGRKGYVHRDIKPENIMINNEDGRAVLMDFGIAKAFDSISDMTQTGTAIGTPYYMSPEQAKGKEVDWRSDIYSLGVVFYQVLTGKLPYQGDSAVSVGIMHLTDPIPQLPEYLQDTFQIIIEKLMAKSPEDRYQNGEDIILALNNISDDDLSRINTEFTKEGHRDSGEHVNYSVSTPISDSGLTSVRHSTSSGNEDATKIVSIPTRDGQKKSYNNTLIFSIVGIVILAIAAFAIYSPKDDEKLNALIESTKIIEQQLNESKKKEAEDLLAKEAKAAEDAQKVIDAKKAESAQINEKLQELLRKASTQEEELTNDIETIDELYQTYQLISLLENDHPTVIKGHETIKSTYIEIIEEQLLNAELKLATKNLNKMLRSFPELETSENIISIKNRINTTNKVNQLLGQADSHFTKNNLSGSSENNAHNLYNQVLKLSPKNVNAKKGIAKINDKYYQNISVLIERRNYKKALSEIEEVEKILSKPSERFTALRSDIEKHIKDSSLAQKKKDKIKRLLMEANIQKENGNLVSDKENSALSLYNQVLSQEPTNQEASLEIAAIEKQLLANIPKQITTQNFTKAQEKIDYAIKYFPKSKAALAQQLSLNSAIKKIADSNKPKITKTIVKGVKFSDITQKAVHKLRADRTIYIGFEYSNFGNKTNVLQAILYAGSVSNKLSTTAVILSKNEGVKYFKISRPVAGFAEGGYFINFRLKNEKVSSYRFSIEN
jgi:serine/threonine protein kinase